MSISNYYKDLWTKEDSHGQKFWNKVDFDDPKYKYQEDVFRTYLKDYVRCKKDIHKVLELGAGKGRMSNILLDELDGQIKQFDVVDLKFEESFTLYSSKVDAYECDITSEDFYILFKDKEYNLILVSEVFMHLKPDDVYKLISFLYTIMAPKGHIINIDWQFEYEKSEWCFIHDYDKIYRENGLVREGYITMLRNKQALLHYAK